MAKKEKGTRQKKKKGRSTQELLGIKTFTKYGLQVGKHELTKAVESFYGKHVPTNVREFIEMRSGDTSDPTPRARRPKPEKKEQPPIVPGTMNESKGGMAHE